LHGIIHTIIIKIKRMPKCQHKNDKKVAVIGAGPAGLSATYYLLKMGYSVKIYENLPVLGGMVAVGIPSFRQPRDLLREEIDDIVKMGAEVVNNVKIGKILNLATSLSLLTLRLLLLVHLNQGIWVL